MRVRLRLQFWNFDYPWFPAPSNRAPVRAYPGISPEIMEILVCPLCKARLEPTASNSALECLCCHRLYPVFDGVPVMYMAESLIGNPFSHDLPKAGWKRTPLPARLPIQE
ncbi:MAG: hypothetical protein IANPNBLG_00077 [Bryobacteraceae bacterium]|nr:hypothetical protein [Bryobacteraceae bacterium]